MPGNSIISLYPVCPHLIKSVRTVADKVTDTLLWNTGQSLVLARHLCLQTFIRWSCRRWRWRQGAGGFDTVFGKRDVVDGNISTNVRLDVVQILVLHIEDELEDAIFMIWMNLRASSAPILTSLSLEGLELKKRLNQRANSDQIWS